MTELVIERRRERREGWVGADRRRSCPEHCWHCAVCWIKGGECADCYPPAVREIAAALEAELATHMSAAVPAQASTVIARRLAVALVRQMAATTLRMPSLTRVDHMRRACRVRHLLAQGVVADIAKRENVHRSTVYRDLNRSAGLTCQAASS